jgi:hypothetical protein
MAIDRLAYWGDLFLSKAINETLKDHKWEGQKPQMAPSKAINGETREFSAIWLVMNCHVVASWGVRIRTKRKACRIVCKPFFA